MVPNDVIRCDGCESWLIIPAEMPAMYVHRATDGRTLDETQSQTVRHDMWVDKHIDKHTDEQTQRQTEATCTVWLARRSTSSTHTHHASCTQRTLGCMEPV